MTRRGYRGYLLDDDLMFSDGLFFEVLYEIVEWIFAINPYNERSRRSFKTTRRPFDKFGEIIKEDGFDLILWQGSLLRLK